MRETGIEWCDATFNPWWGCERVSPGCAHCYADTLAFRYGHVDLWKPNPMETAEVRALGHHFRFFGDKHWAEPLKWARTLPAKLGRRPRVFCASMADVFEERPELEEHRLRLFDLIEQTPELDWLVLTKRPEFARDWLHARRGSAQYRVWLGVSIENARYTWRADVLRQIPAAVRFISAEPLLGSLFTTPRDGAARRDRVAGPRQALTGAEHGTDGDVTACLDVPSSGARSRRPLDLTGIDWVIVGGESGPRARPFHLEHAREVVRAAMQPCLPCRSGAHERHFPREFASDLHAAERPAVFVKQLGADPIDDVALPAGGGRVRDLPLLPLRDRKGGDPDEWPADLRIREFPRSAA